MGRSRVENVNCVVQQPWPEAKYKMEGDIFRSDGRGKPPIGSLRKLVKPEARVQST